MKPKTKDSRLTQLLLWAGCIVPLLCIVTFTLDGATRSGYDSFHHWVSHLSLGPRGWLGTVNLAVTGLGLLAFALGVRHTVRTGKGATWAPRLVALAGLGFVVASIFKQDPGLGYPPNLPAATGSVADNIHGAAALLLFSSLTALCFVLARRFSGTLRRYSLTTPYIVIVSFVTCSVLVSLDYAKVWVGAPSGLLERIALIAALVYVSVFAGYLLRKAGKA